MEDVITSSLSLMANTRIGDWSRLNKKFREDDFLSNQSAVPVSRRNDEEVRQHFTDMNTPEAINGSDQRTYACPMFFVNYLPQRRTG